MKHYEIIEWADYVRGVADRNLAGKMAAHLEEGCTTCRDLCASLQEVVGLADRDRRLELADGAIRSVKALFAQRQPERAAGRLQCLALQLVYDSLLEPAPAGIRGSHLSTRRMVFRGEDIALDLILAQDEASSDLRLTGELVSSTEGPLPDVSAQLVEDQEVIDQSLTGSLGDFFITCEHPETTHLRLLVREGEYIEMALSI